MSNDADVIEPYENTLSIEDLRRELRRAWDEKLALRNALRALPEVPPPLVMKALSSAATFPTDWEIGKKMQREFPGSVPWKTEYQMGAGLYSRIREGLMGSGRNLADAT